jgi:hypothetical protein
VAAIRGVMAASLPEMTQGNARRNADVEPRSVDRVFAALPPSKVTLGLVVQIPAVAALTAAR